MRISVSLIIGTIALMAILSFILNPCLFPHRMIVSITPTITYLSGDNPQNVTFVVFVNDTDGHPIDNATVVIKGLGGAGGGFSDKNGRVIIQIQVQLDDDIYEGYLDIYVKSVCHVSFEHQDMVKVVKSI
jgi:hypothetical protein